MILIFSRMITAAGNLRCSESLRVMAGLFVLVLQDLLEVDPKKTRHGRPAEINHTLGYTDTKCGRTVYNHIICA